MARSSIAFPHLVIGNGTQFVEFEARAQRTVRPRRFVVRGVRTLTEADRAAIAYLQPMIDDASTELADRESVGEVGERVGQLRAAVAELTREMPAPGMFAVSGLYLMSAVIGNRYQGLSTDPIPLSTLEHVDWPMDVMQAGESLRMSVGTLNGAPITGVVEMVAVMHCDEIG